MINDSVSSSSSMRDCVCVYLPILFYAYLAMHVPNRKIYIYMYKIYEIKRKKKTAATNAETHTKKHIK